MRLFPRGEWGEFLDSGTGNTLNSRPGAGVTHLLVGQAHGGLSRPRGNKDMVNSRSGAGVARLLVGQ